MLKVRLYRRFVVEPDAKGLPPPPLRPRGPRPPPGGPPRPPKPPPPPPAPFASRPKPKVLLRRKLKVMFPGPVQALIGTCPKFVAGTVAKKSHSDLQSKRSLALVSHGRSLKSESLLLSSPVVML